MKTRKFEDIDYDKEMLDFESDDILRKKGWEYVCDVPGSLWLWQLKLKDGRVALVNKVSAISIQSWIDVYGWPDKRKLKKPNIID